MHYSHSGASFGAGLSHNWGLCSPLALTLTSPSRITREKMGSAKKFILNQDLFGPLCIALHPHLHIQEHGNGAMLAYFLPSLLVSSLTRSRTRACVYGITDPRSWTDASRIKLRHITEARNKRQSQHSHLYAGTSAIVSASNCAEGGVFSIYTPIVLW